jgi:TRAP-type C4-dicarboxylate transport system substrate-binding protein
MAALDLPVGYPNGIVASKVANEFAKSTQPKELSDVKVLYVHAHGPGLLHTKKKIEKLEDLKSVKIRATGLSTKIVNALGGLPVAMPQGGTYEALQKGVVDGTLGPIEALNGWKQGEVINYTTDCRNIGYTTSMFVVMNKKKWNALPDDIKKVFNEVSEEWVGVHGKAWDVADEAGKNFTLKRGNEIIELTADEKIKWENAVAPIIQSYIEKTPDGKKYVDFIKDCIKKYSK